MNNDIKGILNILKKCKDYGDEVYLIKQHGATLLLDYITNLQQKEELFEKIVYKYDELKQENEMLKQADKNTYETSQDIMAELTRENERLKLEIERLNDVLVHKPDEKIMLKTNDGKELFIIQSERIDMQEELNKANMQLMTQLEDYKSRCEKALKLAESYELGKYDYSIPAGGIMELKDILNGKE